MFEKLFLATLMLIMFYFEAEASVTCFSGQFPLVFGDGVTDDFEFSTMVADSSGNLAVGGVGYPSTTLTERNVPFIGYLVTSTATFTWLQYFTINPAASPAFSSINSILGVVFDPAYEYIYALTYYPFLFLKLSASSGAIVL
jgi:hypothetical protein